MKKILIYLIVITAIATACNKTKQTYKKIYGNHVLKVYTVNGDDSLSFFNDYLGLDFRFYYDRSDYSSVLSIDGSTKTGINAFFVCGWRVLKDNTVFSIYRSAGSNGTGPFGGSKISDWEIISLTNKEFKMKTIYNGKQYLIEL